MGPDFQFNLACENGYLVVKFEWDFSDTKKGQKDNFKMEPKLWKKLLIVSSIQNIRT